MKNFIKRSCAILMIVCLVSACGGETSTGPSKKRPTLDFNQNLADQAIVNTNGEKDINFDNGGEIVLEEGDLSVYSNFIYDETKYAANITNISIDESSSNSASIIIAKVVSEDETEKFVKVTINTADKKALLVVYNDDGETILEESDISDFSFKSSVMLTTEYDNGTASFWIADKCIFSRLVTDLGTTSCYFGYTCEKGEAVFKFIKTFGEISIYEFSLDELFEGKTNLALTAKYTQNKGGSGLQYTPGNIKNTNNHAARVELDNVNLTMNDAFLLKYNLVTYAAKEGYMGMRLSLFRNKDGTYIDLYQLQPSLTWFGTGGNYSYSYTRVLKQVDQYTFYYYNGLITVWLGEEKIFENVKLPGSLSDFTVDIGFLFEFARADVTDVVLVKTEPLTIY